nr:CpsB/CapC family capsule biosynthesis tyrosine phosphatase [Clostridium tetanomorphum]
MIKVLDIHSHILPQIDDGAKSLEISLEMLKMAKKDNVENIIATPHYYRGYYETEYDKVLTVIDKINSEALNMGIDIKVLPGQEIFLDKHTAKLYREGIVKGLNNSKYVLVETAMMDMPKDVLEYIYELKLQGAIPILAHPERYKYIIEKPALINEFGKEGCLFQINTGSIRGIFGAKVQNTAKLLIKHGICNFIASDAHSTGNRCPGLNSSLELVKDINKDVYNSFDINCNLLLKNQDINYEFEEIKEKKSIFSFFRKK